MWSNLFFLLTVLGIVSGEHLFSQTPSYYHYSSSDGLASSTVYQITQDQKGYIWFATSNGISKFDGKHFTTFRTADGLNSNSIISLAEGKRGELYIGNYEKGINILTKNKFENYCNEINGDHFALSYLLIDTVQNNGQKLYFYRAWGALYMLEENTSKQRSTYCITPTPLHLIKLEQVQNNQLIALTTGGLYRIENNEFIKIAVTGLPDTTVYCLSPGNDESYFVGTKNRIFRIQNNQVIKEYKINLFGENNEVIHLLCDRYDNLWFSIMNKGFFIIPKGSDQPINIGIKMGIEHTLVNNYLEDREGNIWLSTFGKGVYCLNHLFLNSYSEEDGLSSNLVYSIVQEKTGKLIIGTFNGINIFDHGKFDQVKSNSGKTLTENISSIHRVNDEFFICGSFGGNEKISTTDQGIEFHWLVQAAFCKLKSRSFVLGQWDNSIVVQHEIDTKNGAAIRQYIFGDSAQINRVNQIFEDTRRNIWIGTAMGLCKTSNFSDQTSMADWKKTFYPKNPVLNARIKTIFEDDQQTVWFAGEKGIACYRLKNDSIETHENLYGYDLSSSTALALDHKNRLWIGNMKGLYCWDGNSIQLFNRKTGLPSDEVFTLCFDENKNSLAIGTSNGLTFFDLDLFEQYTTPAIKIELTGLKAGDSIYTCFNDLVFKPEQNHVYIDYKALCFASPGSIKYKYNINNEWIETDHDFLDLVSLKNGTYHLQIMAKSQNSAWSEPYSLSFQVLPRFVETFWFYILIMLGLGFISMSIMFWRLNLNKRKAQKELELNERINELKHQALSAMMNPHFIFNSLNSVQYLINCQKNEEANHYIATMAKLIRKNLETAGNGFILLSEEIYRLKLYLELEKLRFHEGFTYEIVTAAAIHPETCLIPNMIIQPFVENTLWHGIINSGSTGKVTILFSLEDVEIDSVINQSLIIKITDNGIGINAARMNRKENHISKGIQIIEERLRLLSDKMHLPQPIVLEDLSIRDNTSHGTEVIISLPDPLYKIVDPPFDSIE